MRIARKRSQRAFISDSVRCLHSSSWAIHLSASLVLTVGIFSIQFLVGGVRRGGKSGSGDSTMGFSEGRGMGKIERWTRGSFGSRRLFEFIHERSSWPPVIPKHQVYVQAFRRDSTD